MSELPYNPKTMHVLVADDHVPIRKAVIRVLTKLGFVRITEVSDGRDAIKILRTRVVDACVLDLYMKDVNGFAVLEYVRNREVGSDIPMLVVTGEASKEEIVKAADLGASDYLLKPFHAEDFQRKFETILNKYHQPDDVTRILRKVDRLVIEGKTLEAGDMVDQALSENPDSMRARLLKATILERNGESQKAIELLKTSCEENPSYFRSFRALADMLLKANDFEAAIEAIQHELQINPKLPHRQVQLAKLLYERGNYDGAIEHFRCALVENAKIKTALMGMGHAYAKNGNIEKSLYYFKRVRRYFGQVTPALEAAVKYGLSAGEDRKVEFFLKGEKSSQPDAMDTPVFLAKFYLRQDNVEKAKEELDEVLKRDPNLLPALKILGEIQFRERKFQDAAATWNRIVQAEPTAPNYTQCAKALTHCNERDSALVMLHKALGLSKGSKTTLRQLAETLYLDRQLTKAYFIYRKLHAIGDRQETQRPEAMECKKHVANNRRKARIKKAS